LRISLVVAAAWAWLAIAPAALATTVTLASAANYGILTGQKESLTFSGGLSLAGNLGIGSSSTLKFTGSGNAISGTEYKDSSVSTSGSASISGGVVTQSMSTAINDAVTAATTAASLAATPGLTAQGGSINVTSSSNSIVIKAVQNASENVLNISSLSLTNGSITFDDNGYTNAKFIINVTGGFTVGNNAVIKGINGAGADDIIFNIEGTGSTVNLTGNSSTSIVGTILAPQRNVSLGGGGSLTGALIAGVNNAGKSYTVSQASSGYNITSLGYTPYTPTKVPEPSSWMLYGGGIAALLWFGRARRRVQRGP
jgi:choice-of-anchor A domain-containing protein